MRIALAVLHLLALGIGLGAVYARARALHHLSQDSLKRGFVADSWWGVAALLWISTGLWRVLAGTEKIPSYYWSNGIFLAKMALLLVILVLELWPMITLVRWRIATARGNLPGVDRLAKPAARISAISNVQLLLVIGMVLAAVLVARGYGAR